MTRQPTEKSVKYFRLVTHAMMKASKRENEYFAIKPYFEEAMKSLPEERKELFYMNFEDRIHDIGIAKELNMHVSDVVSEFRKSIIIVLDQARELFFEDNAEEIEEMKAAYEMMSQFVDTLMKGNL